MAGYGHITSGYWPALLIGVVLLLTYIATTTAAVLRDRRSRRNQTEPLPTAGFPELAPLYTGASLWRCQLLIAEALIVRQRLSGEIDAETYRARMNDLARQAVPQRHPQQNA